MEGMLEARQMGPGFMVVGGLVVEYFVANIVPATCRQLDKSCEYFVCTYQRRCRYHFWDLEAASFGEKQGSSCSLPAKPRVTAPASEGLA